MSLCEYIQNDKKVIYMDETNFYLFCKKKQRIGDRIVITLPNSLGPNLHLISGITTTELVA